MNVVIFIFKIKSPIYLDMKSKGSTLVDTIIRRYENFEIMESIRVIKLHLKVKKSLLIKSLIWQKRNRNLMISPVAGGCTGMPSSFNIHSMALVFFIPTLMGSFVRWERTVTPLVFISGQRIPF